MTQDEDASRLRQELRTLLGQHERLQEVFFERGALVRGQVYESKTRCGNPYCHCATGELHPRVAFTVRTPAGQKNRSLSPAARKRLEPLSTRYRQFREARASVVRLHREILDRIDALESALAIEVDLNTLRNEAT